jgi:uncharacterized protein
MSLSLYDISVPLFVSGLKNLSVLLDKAVASGIPEAELLEARLAPDMFPLSKQVQLVSDTSKGASARLAGVDNLPMADTETTVAELKERIAKTVAFIESIDPTKFEGGVDRDVTVPTPSFDLKWKGADYLRQFALPNFYFHITVLYAILRNKGVTIGKQDYLTIDPSAVIPRRKGRRSVDHSVLRFNT